MAFGYTAVGHVTIDVMADGTRRPGGAAFYSALQAARLGQRALIITRGVAREIEELIEPYRGELEIEIEPAPQTTTLQSALHSTTPGAYRTQRMLAWAGPIEHELILDTSILHLAPVAGEIPERWRGHSAFVGLTPQGLMRHWAGEDGEIALAPTPPSAARLGERCDALVLSEHERPGAASLISAATGAGAIVAITAGARATTIALPSGDALVLEIPPVDQALDDLGAGDVFAAAFFVALRDGLPTEEAARLATAAAAVRIQGTGAAAIGDAGAIETRRRAVSGPRGPGL